MNAMACKYFSHWRQFKQWTRRNQPTTVFNIHALDAQASIRTDGVSQARMFCRHKALTAVAAMD